MSDPPIHHGADIWLGDVLDAWRLLGLVTAQDRAAAAAALGFDASLLIPSADEQRPSGSAPGAAEPSSAGSSAHAVPVRAATPAAVIPSVIEDHDVLAIEEEPSWLVNAKPLEPEQPGHATWRPPHVPLFRPQWTRHLMSAIAAVPIAEGTLDEPRLIDAVCRLRPVLHVPRRRRPTLRRGLHLLIDRGDAMMPFRRDADDLVRSLRTTVGRDQLTAATFVGTPLAEPGVLLLRTRDRRSWSAPASGTPILLISDLGLSQRFGATRGASPGEWIEFARRCRVAGCGAPVAVVPRHESTWLPALRRVFTMIPWDQRTSVSTVLRNMHGARPRS